MKKISKVKKEFANFEIAEKKMFHYSVENIEYIDDKAIIHFVRENDIHEQELIKLEKQFSKSSSIPMWLLILLSSLVVTIFTAFIIVFAINRNTLNVGDLFFPMLLPGIICTLAVGILGLIRTKQIQKYVNNSQNRYDEYRKKVEDLYK